MIATVLQNRNADEIWEALENCEMAEIRLDKCPLSLSEIEEVFATDVPLVATCRIGANMSVPQAEKRLIKAIESGARFVDVEIEAPKEMSKRVRSCAHENGTVFIRSYHDFDGTGSVAELKAMVDKCRYHGADMVKVVTTAHSQEDVDRVLSLYDEYEPYGLIAFCMGEAGRQSRMDCLAKGAPYTYACYTQEESAAPGQWTADEMVETLYKDIEFIDAKGLRMPASKSYAQRAIIAAALAKGTSHLFHYSPCGDSEAALKVAAALGAKVEKDGDTVVIDGVAAGTPECTLAKFDELHVGESGLLTRLMIPILAQLSDGPVVLTGEKTLAKRSLDGAPELMSTFGASLESLSDEPGCTVPLKITGPLANGKVEVSGKYGSQLISGLLMALPFAQKFTTVSVVDPKSIPYMYITVEVLKKFGVKIANDMLGGEDFLIANGDWTLCTQIDFKVRGGQFLKAVDLDLEGDWSAAANFLVAGAVFGRVEMEGLDTTSLQADLSVMDILMDAGASLSQEEESGVIVAQRAPLSAFRVDASNCPDLFPIISVLAAFCQGENHIGGVSRLSHKETDRGAAILDMLHQMGVEAGIMEDELVIVGESLQQRLLCGRLLHGGEYTSRHDHRMVMALKVASLGADGPIKIDDEACVAKSFPEFNEMFEQL